MSDIDKTKIYIFGSSLMHSKKGEERPNHKYTAREWANGAWKYIYGKIGGDRLKEYEKSFDQQLLSKKSVENTYNDIEKTNDAIENVGKDKQFIKDIIRSNFTLNGIIDTNRTTGGEVIENIAKKYNYYGGSADRYGVSDSKSYTYEEMEELVKRIEMQESKLKASKERLVKMYNEKSDIYRNKIEKYNKAENKYKKTLLSRIKGDIMKNYTKY